MLEYILKPKTLPCVCILTIRNIPESAIYLMGLSYIIEWPIPRLMDRATTYRNPINLN